MIIWLGRGATALLHDVEAEALQITPFRKIGCRNPTNLQVCGRRQPPTMQKNTANTTFSCGMLQNAGLWPYHGGGWGGVVANREPGSYIYIYTIIILYIYKYTYSIFSDIYYMYIPRAPLRPLFLKENTPKQEWYPSLKLQQSTWNIRVGRWLSFQKGLLTGATVVSGMVYLRMHIYNMDGEIDRLGIAQTLVHSVEPIHFLRREPY